ncbi:class I SAM-dependent methyltransferase [Micromonospora olivasterospora]|uniref:Methyltransferase family protein n=1 Tax=Micromonospora olivasterospora TaxID=1880 RepID=A0A562ICJ8_MICOL|nr:class I SAM-dependent methyltransferase [Micromonospora olivasterospora]TWH68721.1 methyltransferase family protein [Micromonospora olivasterospora]
MTGPAALLGGFEAALAGPPGADRWWLVTEDGVRVPLPVRRWHGGPEPALAGVLDRCAGPTIDLGCGPGRLAAALAGRGLVALGVDVSPAAVRLARARGAVAVRRDLFGPLPAEGRWAHALLVDGNIGIGGDPVRLLRRCAGLVRPGGTTLVEFAPPGSGLWRGGARVTSGSPGGERLGASFRWAWAGVEWAPSLAAAAGLTVAAVLPLDGRWFVELSRP